MRKDIFIMVAAATFLVALLFSLPKEDFELFNEKKVACFTIQEWGFFGGEVKKNCYKLEAIK